MKVHLFRKKDNNIIIAIEDTFKNLQTRDPDSGAEGEHERSEFLKFIDRNMQDLQQQNEVQEITYSIQRTITDKL